MSSSRIPRAHFPSPRAPLLAPFPPALLLTLQAAHRQIDAATEEMERIASAELPELGQFSASRMRLAQANLARRRLVDQISSHLISRLPAKEYETVRRLRRQDEDCFQKVSKYVRQWTTEAVSKDWAGYCAASRTTRSGILQIVAAEKAVLYPFLASRS